MNVQSSVQPNVQPNVQPVSPKTMNLDLPGDRKEPEPEKKQNGDKQQPDHYTKAEIRKEVERLNKLLQEKESHLHFVLHDKLNEYYVQVVDDKTDEVIKEIPSKKIMDIVASFYENLGLIIDKKI